MEQCHYLNYYYYYYIDQCITFLFPIYHSLILTDEAPVTRWRWNIQFYAVSTTVLLEFSPQEYSPSQLLHRTTCLFRIFREMIILIWHLLLANPKSAMMFWQRLKQKWRFTAMRSSIRHPIGYRDSCILCMSWRVDWVSLGEYHLTTVICSI